MAITFACPTCGKDFTVDEEMGGKAGECLACGGPIAIPHKPTFVPVDPDAQPRRREPGPVKVIGSSSGQSWRQAWTPRRMILGAASAIVLITALIALAWPRDHTLVPGTKVMMVSHDKTFKFVDSHYLVFNGNVEPGISNGTEAVIIGPSEKDNRIQCKLTSGPYEGYFGDFDAADLVPID